MRTPSMSGVARAAPRGNAMRLTDAGSAVTGRSQVARGLSGPAAGVSNGRSAAGTASPARLGNLVQALSQPGGRHPNESRLTGAGEKFAGLHGAFAGGAGVPSQADFNRAANLDPASQGGRTGSAAVNSPERMDTPMPAGGMDDGQARGATQAPAPVGEDAAPAEAAAEPAAEEPSADAGSAAPAAEGAPAGDAPVDGAAAAEGAGQAPEDAATLEEFERLLNTAVLASRLDPTGQSPVTKSAVAMLERCAQALPAQDREAAAQLLIQYMSEGAGAEAMPVAGAGPADPAPAMAP